VFERGSKMKVKTFTGFTESGLDRKINAFLDGRSIEVVDIKFSSSLFYLGAMVIYKKKL
jgi:hypothetical protein